MGWLTSHRPDGRLYPWFNIINRRVKNRRRLIQSSLHQEKGSTLRVPLFLALLVWLSQAWHPMPSLTQTWGFNPILIIRSRSSTYTLCGTPSWRQVLLTVLVHGQKGRNGPEVPNDGPDHYAWIFNISFGALIFKPDPAHRIIPFLACQRISSTEVTVSLSDWTSVLVAYF